MKTVLSIIFVFFLIGCTDQKTSQKNTIQTNNTKDINITEKKTVQKNKITIIKEKDFNLSFEKNRLIYPKEKTILLFYSDNFYSKEEEKILNKLNVKFYKTDNEYLKKYFKINYFPTIIVLDKNKTVKFENFTPYEILKTEGL